MAWECVAVAAIFLRTYLSGTLRYPRSFKQNAELFLDVIGAANGVFYGLFRSDWPLNF